MIHFIQTLTTIWTTKLKHKRLLYVLIDNYCPLYIVSSTCEIWLLGLNLQQEITYIWIEPWFCSLLPNPTGEKNMRSLSQTFERPSTPRRTLPEEENSPTSLHLHLWTPPTTSSVRTASASSTKELLNVTSPNVQPCSITNRSQLHPKQKPLFRANTKLLTILMLWSKI